MIGPAGRAVVDVTDAQAKVDADLRIHGVQGDFHADQQHVEQRDGKTSAGELSKQQDQNHLKQEQHPLAAVDRDLLRAVNQRSQQLRNQEAQNVAGGENLAELGVVVATSLKVDGGIAHDPAETDPVEALNQSVFQIYDTKPTGRIMHRNHLFFIKCGDYYIHCKEHVKWYFYTILQAAAKKAYLRKLSVSVILNPAHSKPREE